MQTGEYISAEVDEEVRSEPSLPYTRTQYARPLTTEVWVADSAVSADHYRDEVVGRADCAVQTGEYISADAGNSVL